MDKKIFIEMPVEHERESNEMSFQASSGSTPTETIVVGFEELQEIADSFPNFKMETIELHLKAVMGASGFTKLVVDLKGEAGVKLVLKRDESHLDK